ncbi:MAG: AAA family ATPase [Planctomycetaceae bacterium]|nr:AAA family ATPase [Planctomycetaceae bacterium]
MPKFIKPERVRSAIDALSRWRREAHNQGAQHIWPLLALIERRAAPGTPVVFTESDDRDFWDRYARLPGDSRDRQTASGEFTQGLYVDPLVLQKKPSDYPHRGPSTIRDRTFLNSWRAAVLDHATNTWTLQPEFASIFVREALTKARQVYRVPVVDLAVWLFRRRPFDDDADARTLERTFREVFPFSDDDYRKIFAFREEEADHLFTEREPGDREYLEEIERALVPTGPADTIAQAAPAGVPIDLDAGPPLDDDDPVLIEVKRLVAIHTSGIVLRGCPGTSKTWYANRLARYFVTDPVSHIFRVQFHPSYGYEDFVEGYQPDEDARSGFSIVPRVFREACDLAAELKQSGHTGRIVMILDEINRGDPARIFGDLLTYIEHGYRNRTFRLPYTQDEAQVPDNLLLIGTMNHYDRSITQLDLALIRRFDHVDLSPSSGMVRAFLEGSEFSPEQADRIVTWFENLQSILPPASGGIGHTYFKDVRTAEQLFTVWRYRMQPYCEAVLELEPTKLNNAKASFESMRAALMRQAEEQ